MDISKYLFLDTFHSRSSDEEMKANFIDSNVNDIEYEYDEF